MAKLLVFIDSSTKSSSVSNKYGESIAAWAAWWEGTLYMKPVRCGIYYFRYEGPNITFYQGVIRTLEQCMDLIWQSDELIIYGDCEAVIKQICGQRRVNKMRLYYKQVQALITKYHNKVKLNKPIIQFEYKNNNDPIYKKIDQLAKRSRSHITNILR